jgi:hypothetical protein
MDNINVNNLFLEKSDEVYYVQKLYDPLTKNYEHNFNIDNIIAKQEEKRDKLDNIYKEIFRKCLIKIDHLNNKYIMDVIYEIPEYIVGCIGYSVSECIAMIQISLRKLFMETLIIDNNKIFISWYNIKENKKKFEKNSK